MKWSRIFPFILVPFSLVLPLVLTEFYFHLTSSSAYEITLLQQKAETDGPCVFDEYYYPHPTLGFALRDSPDCKLKVSNLGTHGEDLPYEKKDHEFIILMLGGSVAQHVTATFPPFKVNQVEKHLNRMFIAPGNKKIRVINGANSGWKQPVQVLQFLSHAHRIDAFISLEGYNETDSLIKGIYTDVPGFPYFFATDFPDVSRWKIHFLHKSMEYIRRSNFLKNSYLANHVIIRIKPLIVDEFIRNINASYLLRKRNQNFNAIDKGLNDYSEKITFLDAIAKAHEKPGIVFIQPMPALRRGKLHERDWPSRTGVSGETYQLVVDHLSGLKLKHIKIESLIDIFENERRWVYHDNIHSPVHMKTGYSVGYDVLGKAIATKTGEHLNFKARR